jgi:hypothetical protein
MSINRGGGGGDWGLVSVGCVSCFHIADDSLLADDGVLLFFFIMTMTMTIKTLGRF